MTGVLQFSYERVHGVGAAQLAAWAHAEQRGGGAPCAALAARAARADLEYGDPRRGGRAGARGHALTRPRARPARERQQRHYRLRRSPRK